MEFKVNEAHGFGFPAWYGACCFNQWLFEWLFNFFLRPRISGYKMCIIVHSKFVLDDVALVLCSLHIRISSSNLL